MVYQHYKGNKYCVLGEALDTATNKMVIIYQPLYKTDYNYFTRPKEEFFGKVCIGNVEVDRFKFLY